MAFPSPSLIPPALADFQWQYNGLTMGADTAFGVLKVEGLDLPDVRSGDVNWPRDHGQAAGLDLYGGQDIIFDLWMKSGLGPILPGVPRPFLVEAENEIFNPNFEYDTIGAEPAWWVFGTYTTKVVQASPEGFPSAGGSKSLRLTTPSDAGERSPIQSMPAKEGLSYTFHVAMDVLAVTGGKKAVLIVHWNNSKGERISEIGSSAVSTAGVHTLELTGVAPAGTVEVQVFSCYTAGPTGIFDTYLDEIYFGPAGFSYFDGDFPDAGWLGAPGNSASALYGASLQQSQIELAAATAVSPSSESPLWFQLPNMPLLCVMCRPRKRPMAVDSDYAAAQVGKPELVLHATDPRFYGAGQAVTLTLAATSGGLVFPVTFPVTFSVTTPSTAVLSNGNAEMRPTVLFNGPLTNPAIENGSIEGEPFIKLVNPEGEGFTVAEGDQVLVDLGTPHLAQYYKGGVASGSEPTNVMSWITSTSTWWDLLPADNTLRFYSADAVNTGGSCTIQWAPAYVI